MATGYTPGLTVSPDTIISKTRRLPLKGKTLVEIGQRVGPETIIARAELPGIMHTVKAASALGMEPGEVENALTVKIGDSVTRGQVVAHSSSLWGLIKSDAKATTTGMVEMVSPITGNIGIREAPTPIEINAYIPGIVTEVIAGEGAVVTARGAMAQGIFGVGGERRAPLLCVAERPTDTLTETDITPETAGKIIVGGANITGAALKKAAESGVVGIIVGGIIDTDLVEFLGYDIGVAITGHEDIPLTLILTEGFGNIAMAARTFRLFSERNHRLASLSGATQIRAGVIRPEVIIADESADISEKRAADGVEDNHALAIGTQIRIIREPYFGILATVTKLPSLPVKIDSGAVVRVLEAALPDGNLAVVPRANVEIIG